jgi:CRISPR-associated endonuclease Cas2
MENHMVVLGLMGIMEKEVKRKIRMTKIQTGILTAVYAAGILSVALLAPNVLSVMQSASKKSGLYDRVTRGKKQSINISRKRLIEAGLLVYENGFLRLTKEGEKRMHEFEARNFSLDKPRKWDGKWRVLIFDIKETRKAIRDKMRYILRSIGFIRLQNSVWVYPYDREDLVTMFKADMEIGKDLLYLIVDKLENDNHVRSHFGL